MYQQYNFSVLIRRRQIQMNKIFRVLVISSIVLMMTFLLTGFRKDPQNDALSRATIDINPSIKYQEEI